MQNWGSRGWGGREQQSPSSSQRTAVVWRLGGTESKAPGTRGGGASSPGLSRVQCDFGCDSGSSTTELSLRCILLPDFFTASTSRHQPLRLESRTLTDMTHPEQAFNIPRQWSSAGLGGR